MMMDMMAYEEMTVMENENYKAYEETLDRYFDDYRLKDFEDFLCDTSSYESYSEYYECYLAIV